MGTKFIRAPAALARCCQRSIREQEAARVVECSGCGSAWLRLSDVAFVPADEEDPG